MLIASLLLSLSPVAIVDELPEVSQAGYEAPILPTIEELTNGDSAQHGGSCPDNAPLLCDNAYCCPQSNPYCCPGQQCGTESSCGGGGGGDGGGGGSCDAGEASCDGGCCPSGSVCGTPGTGTCCPDSAPYHCSSEGTCGTDSSDPCGSGGTDPDPTGGGGTDPTGGGGTCDDGGTACDGGCCPSGSVCGTSGTGTCCPVDAPYHCASEGTCSADPGACDDGGGGGEGGGGGGTCSGDASGYPGLPADIQVWSQCASACSYCGVGNQEGVDANCSILSGFDSSYPGQCSYCSQDCSTPSGDQGDPGSVSTKNDDSADACSIGGRSTPLWSSVLLVVLFGLRRRRTEA